MFPVADPYVSYAQFKNYRSPSRAIADASLVEELLVRAARTFETNCSRTFLPYRETRYYDFQRDPVTTGWSVPTDMYPALPLVRQGVDTRVLKVGDDLLEVLELKTQNGDLTITADQYYLMCGATYNVRPYDRIVMDETTGVLFTAGDSYQRTNELTALWGYHEEWSNAWLEADSLAGDINTTVTTFSTNGSYSFAWGQLLKINDEYMLVTDVSTPTTPIVERAKRGTVAAAHSQDDYVYIFQPHLDIVQAVLRLTDFLYTQKDTKDGASYRDIITATGVILRPASLPGDVRDAISFYSMQVEGMVFV